MDKDEAMKSEKTKWTAGLLLAGVAFAFLDAILLEKLFFEIKTFDIGNTGGRKKLRIVLLTDLHFKEKLWPYYVKLAKKVNQLKPDFIMIAGDTLDRTGKTSPMKKFFSLLDHHIPKVAIAGNHDHKATASLQSLRQIYKQHNCTFLLNETESFNLHGTKLTITGLDDFIEGSGNLRAAVANTAHEAHHFLLIHSPLQQEVAQQEIAAINRSRTSEEKLNISYIFAGHNHGGQVALLGYAPKLPVKAGNYVNGWYNRQKPFLYVSKGFGTTTVPFRFGARSEVTLLNYFV